jgi:hypothetical protein
MVRDRSLTIGWDNWYGLSTGMKSEPACFAFVDMGAMIADDGIRRLLEMCTCGQLIGHCTRGNEQGGLLPKQSSYVGLKGSSIRLVIDVISKRGLNSVLVHLLRGN